MNARTSALRGIWQQRVQAPSAQLRLWWQQRARREQRLILLAAVVLGAAVLWLWAVRPALDSVRQSRARLPVLHAQAAQVRALLLETQSLQRRRTGRIAPEAMQDAIHASLRRAGLDAAAAMQPDDSVQTDDTLAAQSTTQPTTETRQWNVVLQDASAARVMAWLAELPQQLQLRIQSVDLARAQHDGRERPGNVSGNIVLVYPEAP